MKNTTTNERRAKLCDFLDAWLEIDGGKSLDATSITAIFVRVEEKGLLPPSGKADMSRENRIKDFSRWVDQCSGIIYREHIIDDRELVPVGEIEYETQEIDEFRDGQLGKAQIVRTNLDNWTGEMKFLGLTEVLRLGDDDGPSVMLYERNPGQVRHPDVPAFFADVSFGISNETVVLPTWLDVARLLNLMIPIIVAMNEKKTDND